MELFQEVFQSNVLHATKNQETEILVTNPKGLVFLKTPNAPFALNEDVSHIPAIQSALTTPVSLGATLYRLLPQSPRIMGAHSRDSDLGLIFLTQTPYEPILENVEAQTNHLYKIFFIFYLSMILIFGFGFWLSDSHPQSSRTSVPKKKKSNLKALEASEPKMTEFKKAA